MDFEVIETDALFSDGHALLSWSFSTTCFDPNVHLSNGYDYTTYKKWDQKYAADFVKHMSLDKLNDVYSNLEPMKSSIDISASKIADIFVTAAKRSFPNRKYPKHKSRHKSYFGFNCHTARKQSHLARKLIKDIKIELTIFTLYNQVKSTRKH